MMQASRIVVLDDNNIQQKEEINKLYKQFMLKKDGDLAIQYQNQTISINKQAISNNNLSKFNWLMQGNLLVIDPQLLSVSINNFNQCLFYFLHRYLQFDNIQPINVRDYLLLGLFFKSHTLLESIKTQSSIKALTNETCLEILKFQFQFDVSDEFLQISKFIIEQKPKIFQKHQAKEFNPMLIYFSEQEIQKLLNIYCEHYSFSNLAFICELNMGAMGQSYKVVLNQIDKLLIQINFKQHSISKLNSENKTLQDSYQQKIQKLNSQEIAINMKQESLIEFND